MDPLHTLLAIALELPEDFFVKLHQYKNNSEDHLRYMKYGKFTPEEQESLAKGDGLWSYGHTDLGTLTLLFRQPVAALQIKDHKTGDWKWAKPLDGSLTVNTCDALSFLTGNYIKSTVHRVGHNSKLVDCLCIGISPSQRPATCRPTWSTLLRSASERSEVEHYRQPSTA